MNQVWSEAHSCKRLEVCWHYNTKNCQVNLCQDEFHKCTICDSFLLMWAAQSLFAAVRCHENLCEYCDSVWLKHCKKCACCPHSAEIRRICSRRVNPNPGPTRWRIRNNALIRTGRSLHHMTQSGFITKLSLKCRVALIFFDVMGNTEIEGTLFMTECFTVAFLGT